jgi:hypothetical protein
VTLFLQCTWLNLWFQIPYKTDPEVAERLWAEARSKLSFAKEVTMLVVMDIAPQITDFVFEAMNMAQFHQNGDDWDGSHQFYKIIYKITFYLNCCSAAIKNSPPCLPIDFAGICSSASPILSIICYNRDLFPICLYIFGGLIFVGWGWLGGGRKRVVNPCKAGYLQ